MYKLIACDMDGTLINSNRELSEATIEYIKNIKNEIFVPATGRILEFVIDKFKGIDTFKYIIAMNGAVIYDRENEEIIYEKYLSKEACSDIWKKFKDGDFQVSCLGKEMRYRNKDIGMTHHNVINENLGELLESIDDKIYTISVMSEDKDKLKEYENLLDPAEYDIENMESSYVKGRYFLAVSAKGSSKDKAIEYILEKENLNWNNVIAFGDGENDICMLKKAGNGVAMKNAREVVKPYANEITEYENNEDGVIRHLERGYNV